MNFLKAAWPKKKTEAPPDEGSNWSFYLPDCSENSCLLPKPKPTPKQRILHIINCICFGKPKKEPIPDKEPESNSEDEQRVVDIDALFNKFYDRDPEETPAPPRPSLFVPQELWPDLPPDFVRPCPPPPYYYVDSPLLSVARPFYRAVGDPKTRGVHGSPRTSRKGPSPPPSTGSTSSTSTTTMATPCAKSLAPMDFYEPLVRTSCKKIVANRHLKGGPSIERNLLVCSVLVKIQQAQARYEALNSPPPVIELSFDGPEEDEKPPLEFSVEDTEDGVFTGEVAFASEAMEDAQPLSPALDEALRQAADRKRKGNPRPSPRHKAQRVSDRSVPVSKF